MEWLCSRQLTKVFLLLKRNKIVITTYNAVVRLNTKQLHHFVSLFFSFRQPLRFSFLLNLFVKSTAQKLFPYFMSVFVDLDLIQLPIMYNVKCRPAIVQCFVVCYLKNAITASKQDINCGNIFYFTSNYTLIHHHKFGLVPWCPIYH